jgi:hypothetical protein
MIAIVKPLPVRRLGDVVIDNAPDTFSIGRIAIFGLAAYFFWQAIKKVRG